MARARFKTISQMRPKTEDADYHHLWRCKHCSVGVITRDRGGHLARCQGGKKGEVEAHFSFERDLAA
jgi:hypothetical protein